MESSFLFPSVTLPSSPRLPPSYPFPLPGRCQPASANASPPAPLGVLSVAPHRSRNNRVEMYCATVFCSFLMYTYIVSKPASALTVSDDVYSCFPSDRHRRSILINLCTTWSWNFPRILPMWEVTTHFSTPNIGTDWTMSLRKIRTPAYPPPPCWGSLSSSSNFSYYKMWYLFLYFGILHSKSVILLGLCLVFVIVFLPFSSVVL